MRFSEFSDPSGSLSSKVQTVLVHLSAQFGSEIPVSQIIAGVRATGTHMTPEALADLLDNDQELSQMVASHTGETVTLGDKESEDPMGSDMEAPDAVDKMAASSSKVKPDAL